MNAPKRGVTAGNEGIVGQLSLRIVASAVADEKVCLCVTHHVRLLFPDDQVSTG
jgi:hypothetical protein